MVFLGKLFSKLTTRTRLIFRKFCGGENVDGNMFVDVSGFCTLENALPAKERTAVASDNTFMLTIPINVPPCSVASMQPGGWLIDRQLRKGLNGCPSLRSLGLSQGVLTLSAHRRALELSRLRRLTATCGFGLCGGFNMEIVEPDDRTWGDVLVAVAT